MSGWEEKNYKLTRTYLFKDFVSAFTFLTEVAELAESENHHPDIFNSYNKVTLMLCTHDAGNKVTQKDRDMAAAIESLYNSYPH